MASIQDFFSKSFGAVENPVTRITHGTTYQRWTFGCCSACCQCIPTSTDYYAYEMWGQGASGSYGRCCQGGIEGGTGSGAAGVRISYLSCSSNRQMCFCACSCYCCSDGAGCCGHCGQFTRLCLCGLGHCSVKGGGCIGGASECWYIINDGTCLDCWIPERDTERVTFGGGGGGSGSIYTSCCQSNNVCMFNPDPDVSDIGDNGASSGGASGQPLCYYHCYYPCSCGPWNGIGHCSYMVECYCGGGVGGWACGSRQSCCLGVGGGGYAGGAPNRKWQASDYRYKAGCQGHAPGGGGSSGSAQGGPCCWGGRGGPGLIIVSIDT